MRPAESQMAGGYYYSGFVLSFAGREWGVDSLFALDASILSRDPITSLVPKPASAVFLNLVSVRPPEPSVNPTNKLSKNMLNSSNEYCTSCLRISQ